MKHGSKGSFNMNIMCQQPRQFQRLEELNSTKREFLNAECSHLEHNQHIVSGVDGGKIAFKSLFIH